jgi:hypothetical protein
MRHTLCALRFNPQFVTRNTISADATDSTDLTDINPQPDSPLQTDNHQAPLYALGSALCVNR